MSSAAPTAIENYYDLHARIYDATRWSFLFGRGDILRHIPGQPSRILEVGCGTGKNLEALCRRFPEASVTGVDLSESMLGIARKKCEVFGSRVTLLRQCYDVPVNAEGGFDLVLFSYALSMFNPGFKEAITAAHADLVPGGCIALVDFHATRSGSFARWMEFNHVQMTAHLRPVLLDLFEPHMNKLRPAYLGLWHYLLFTGIKR